MLSLALVACGKEKAAEPKISTPADAPAAAAPPAQPSQDATASAEAPAGVDGHDLYAAKCISCHGETGEGLAGNPKLAGLTKADIQSRLIDYRAGKQRGPKTPIMASMAKPLTDQQIAALAIYIGE